MIGSIKFAHTRQARAGGMRSKYATFDLEDMSGAVRCILWPEPFSECGHLLEPDRILAAKGTVDRRPGSEEVNLIVHELIPIADLAARLSRGVVVQVNENRHGERALEQLREILRGYPGDKALKLELVLLDGWRVELSCDSHRILLDPELRRRIDELLGPGHFRLIMEPRPTTAPRARSNGRLEFASRAV
jgi:DNA polymerase-3 subunit alpha